MLRVYISPVVGSGTRQDPYRAKALDMAAAVGGHGSSFFPSSSDGTPASTWVLCAVRADDFSTLDADATLDDLFGGDLPASVQTREDLLALLRGRTVSDVPVARRNKITAVLDKYGVRRDDFVGSTPLWKVMQRVASTLFEADYSFASAF